MLPSSPVIDSRSCPTFAKKNPDDRRSSGITEITEVHNTSSAVPSSPYPPRGTNGVETPTTIKSYFLAVTSGEEHFTEAQKKHPVATFGLSEERKELAKFARKKLGLETLTLIDKYNEKIGIIFQPKDWELLGISQKELFQSCLENIIEIVDNLPENVSRQSHNPKFFAWADYLYANKEKVDPIIRIRTLLTQSEADGNRDNLEQFVIKNSRLDANIGEMIKHLEYLVLDLGCTNSAEVHQALLSYQNEKGESLLSPANYLDFARLINNHFFRNTSKLGLEFFASRGHDIAFAWNKGDDTKFDLGEVMDKPWKRSLHRYDVKELITFSEIRSLIRNKKRLFDFNNVFKLYISDIKAEIAPSLTSGKWVDLA